MDLESQKPENIIETGWIDEYYQYIKLLTAQLSALNTSIYNLDKILNFPFNLLQVDRSFWSGCGIILAHDCIMIVWRMAVDTSVDGYSINHVKNEIYKHLLRDELRQDFATIIRKGGFTNKVYQLTAKVEAIRHKFLAHFSVSYVTKFIERVSDETAFTLEDLISYGDVIEGYFAVLCFGFEIKRPWEIYEDGHIMHKTNIQEILDTLAVNSLGLYLPEKDSNKWNEIKKQYSYENLTDFNRYRTKFGLAAIE